jgi:glutamyl-tRNA reductase
VSEAAVPLPWQEVAERRPAPVAPVALASLLRYGDEIRAAGLARAERRLRSLSPEARRAAEALVARIVDEFLRVPATCLQEAAASPDGVLYARVVQDIFRPDGGSR